MNLKIFRVTAEELTNVPFEDKNIIFDKSRGIIFVDELAEDAEGNIVEYRRPYSLIEGLTEEQIGSILHTPYINEDGFWVIGGQATEFKAQGEAGLPGADGQHGENGKDGRPGADGNSIVGPQGLPGRDGRHAYLRIAYAADINGNLKKDKYVEGKHRYIGVQVYYNPETPESFEWLRFGSETYYPSIRTEADEGGKERKYLSFSKDIGDLSTEEVELPDGPVGPEGPPGKGIAVQGTLYSKESLPTDLEISGELAPAYFIGTDLWVYTGTEIVDENNHNGFTNVGNVKGEKGDTGTRGPIPDHSFGIAGDGRTTVRFQKPDGTLGQSVTIEGEKGDTGPTPQHQWTLENEAEARIRFSTDIINGEPVWGEDKNIKGPKGQKGDKPTQQEIQDAVGQDFVRKTDRGLRIRDDGKLGRTDTTGLVTSITLGDWTITADGSTLRFKYQGSDVYTVSNTGVANLT